MATHLAVVDSNDRANHLGDDDHVAQVRLDDRGLLVWGRLLLGLAQLLDEAHRLALEAALEPAARARVDNLQVTTTKVPSRAQPPESPRQELPTYLDELDVIVWNQ